MQQLLRKVRCCRVSLGGFANVNEETEDGSGSKADELHRFEGDDVMISRLAPYLQQLRGILLAMLLVVAVRICSAYESSADQCESVGQVT